jgi:hypothetical protein
MGNLKLAFAQGQILNTIKFAFKLIDIFAQPSLPPEYYYKYEEVKKFLLKEYKLDKEISSKGGYHKL